MRMGQRGFTMTETLVVIALILIISAIAVPSLYKLRQSSSTKEAAWGIVSGFRLGKQMALSTNLEHRVEFDMVGKRYRLARGNMPSGSTVWTGAGSWSSISNEVGWATGAACDGNADLNIIFKPNGSSASGVICVKDAESAVKYRVSVNATSGRAVIN